MTKAFQSFLDEIKPILTVAKHNYNVLVFGKTGFGKTSWVRGLLLNKKRLIILDTLEYEYDENDGTIVHSYRELIAALIQNPEEFRIVYRCTDEALKLFELWTVADHICLVIEEADIYKDEELESIVNHMKRGRHKENDLVVLTRHPLELHPELRKHCKAIVSFQQDDVNTLKYLQTINKDLAAELPALQIGEVRVLTGLDYLEEFYRKE